MKFHIGDKVKFMDQEGQGTVTRIINATTVGVTTDGFELPFAITDLIKIEKPASTAERLFYEGKSSYGVPPEKGEESLSGKKDEKKSWTYTQQDISVISHTDPPRPDPEPDREETSDPRITPLKRGFVSKHPQTEGVYLGMVPLDQQFMLRGPVDLYVINYTPYTLLYNFATRGAESFYGVDFASVPPYSKILVESIDREDLGLWNEGVLQCLFFQDESPIWLLPGSCDYKVKGNRFGLAESYVHTVFLQEKVLLVPILNLAEHKADNSLAHQSLFADKAAGNGTAGKNEQPRTAGASQDPMARYMIKKDMAEVDLHIEKLVESHPEWNRLREEEYLNRQISVFEDTLNKAISRKLSKIIFIHGVGNGILKHEIEKRLKEYPGLHFMDASIVKYGRGAIEVYIDTQK